MVESVNNIIIMSQWRRQPGLSVCGFLPNISSFIANSAVQFTFWDNCKWTLWNICKFSCFQVVQMMVLFLVFTPCSALGLFWHYKGVYCLHNQDNLIGSGGLQSDWVEENMSVRVFLKDSYETDIFSPIQPLQHALEWIHSLWRWRQHVPPKCQKKYSVLHIVKALMMTTSYPEHFAKPNCMHNSNLQQTSTTRHQYQCNSEQRVSVKTM